MLKNFRNIEIPIRRNNNRPGYSESNLLKSFNMSYAKIAYSYALDTFPITPMMTTPLLIHIVNDLKTLN